MIVGVLFDAAVFIVSRLFKSSERFEIPRLGPQMSSNAFAEARHAYAKWAATRCLEAQTHRDDVYNGLCDGRRLVLTTGVSSRSPIRPDIAIHHASEGLDAFVSLRRGERLPDLPLAEALAPLLNVECVEEVAITRSMIRLTFRLLEHPDSFDEPLELVRRALTPERSGAYR